MMRDVRNLSRLGPSVCNRITRAQNLGVIGSTTYDANQSMAFYRSQRDDSTPTVPLDNGLYYAPTDYGSFFWQRHLNEEGYEWLRLNAVNPDPKFAYYYYRSRTSPNGGADTCRVSFNPPGTGQMLGVTAQLRPNPSAYTIATARSRALAEIMSSDFNALQFVGEMREVGKTVSDILKAVGRLRRGLNTALSHLLRGSHHMSDLRRVNTYLSTASRSQMMGVLGRQRARIFEDIARDARRSQYTTAHRLGGMKGLASAYLTYIYGVRPLIMDAYALVDALAHKLGKPVHQTKVTFVDPDFGVGIYPLVPAGDLVEVTGEAVLGVTVSVTWAVRNPHLYELSRYGVLNPAAALWELSPLSFIVDWFTGIGGFLRSLDASMSIRVLSGYETHFLRYNVDYGINTWKPSSSRERTSVPLRLTVWHHQDQCKAFWRYINPLPPIPPIYLRVGLNSGQIMSSLALITANVLR